MASFTVDHAFIELNMTGFLNRNYTLYESRQSTILFRVKYRMNLICAPPQQPIGDFVEN